MKGIFIPDEFNGKGLNISEKVILAVYKYYTEEGKTGCCKMTNEQISEITELSTKTIKRVKGHLKELGYIKTNGGIKVWYIGFKGGQNDPLLVVRGDKMTPKGGQNDPPRGDKMTLKGGQNDPLLVVRGDKMTPKGGQNDPLLVVRGDKMTLKGGQNDPLLVVRGDKMTLKGGQNDPPRGDKMTLKGGQNDPPRGDKMTLKGGQNDPHNKEKEFSFIKIKEEKKINKRKGNFDVAYSQLDERYRSDDNYNFLIGNKEWVDNLNSLPEDEFNESLGMIISSIECNLKSHNGETIKKDFDKKQPVRKLSKTITDVFDI